MKRFLALVPLVVALAVGPAAEEGMLVDDFSREDGVSALGTAWRDFTDRVMGGVSSGAASVETIGGRRCLRLRGRVSLENNGGFIQVALPLVPGRGSFDASRFSGILLRVRGNGESGYYVHLRTADTRLPWQYYQAELPVGADWTEVRIPFSEFEPQSLDRELDPRRLSRLGIVAAKRAFEADIAVGHVSLYRKLDAGP